MDLVEDLSKNISEVSISRTKVEDSNKQVIEKYEPKPTTIESIHHILLVIYRSYRVESIQDLCSSLELFGYLVGHCSMIPSVELALVCFIVINKFYQDRNSLCLSHALYYCRNRYIYDLEKEVIWIYFHSRISRSIVIEELYYSLNMTDYCKLLEDIAESNFSLDIVAALIEYGGSKSESKERDRSSVAISRWLWSVRQKYIMTVIENPYRRNGTLKAKVESGTEADDEETESSSWSEEETDDEKDVDSPTSTSTSRIDEEETDNYILEQNNSNAENIKRAVRSIITGEMNENIKYALHELCDWYYEITGKRLHICDILDTTGLKMESKE